MKKITTLFTLLALCVSVNFLTAASGLKYSKSDSCAQIVLKTGDIISANVIQISPIEVKYKRCGKPNDPEIVLPLKKVLKIKDADGGDIWVGGKDTDENSGNGEKKLSGLGLASMILGIFSAAFGIFGYGLLTGILAVIFGSISLYKIIRNPDKFKGKGMAWAGLICGIVGIGLSIFLLILFL
jgi:hypothetical protein